MSLTIKQEVELLKNEIVQLKKLLARQNKSINASLKRAKRLKDDIGRRV